MNFNSDVLMTQAWWIRWRVISSRKHIYDNFLIIYIAIHQLIQVYLFNNHNTIHQIIQVYLLIIHVAAHQSVNALSLRIIHFHCKQNQSTCLNFVHRLISRRSQVAIVKKINLKTSKRFIKREMSTTKSRRFEFLNCATLSFDSHHLKTNNWDWRKILKIKWWMNVVRQRIMIMHLSNAIVIN